MQASAGQAQGVKLSEVPEATSEVSHPPDLEQQGHQGPGVRVPSASWNLTEFLDSSKTRGCQVCRVCTPNGAASQQTGAVERSWISELL